MAVNNKIGLCKGAVGGAELVENDRHIRHIRKFVFAAKYGIILITMGDPIR